MLSRDVRRTPVLPMFGLIAATVAVLDAIRVLMALGSRSVGVRLEAAAIVAVLVVLTIPLIERSNRNTVLALTAVVVAARIGMQLLSPSPTLIGQAPAAAIVLGTYGALVAAYAIVFGGRVVGLGVVAGSAVDVGLLASLATLPLPWWRGTGPVLGWLAAAAVVAAASVVEQRLTMPTRPPARVPAVALGMVGAWVALHVMLIANLGWVNALSNAAPWLAAAGASLGLAGALVWETQGRSESRPVVAAVIALVGATLFVSAEGGWAVMLVAVIAASAGVALTGALERDSAAAPERLQWATGAIPALAVLPVAARESTRLGSNGPAQIVVLTVLVLLGAAVLTTRHNPGSSGVAPMAAAIGITAAVAAVVASLVGGAAEAEPGPAGELLVATFNLERGFSPDGAFDPHGAAQTLIDLGADVAAVQDVARGRIRDGAVDLVVFLERRTGTEIHWVGQADGTGAAIELRVPAAEVGDRSIVGVADIVEARIGEGEQAIRVLAVDAVGAPTAREDVGEMLAGVWGGAPHTVMAGSFDGSADTEPVVTLMNAGLFDVTLVLDGIVPLTSPAALPTMQQDFILISQDLRPAGARIGEVTSSDHLPVVSRVGIPDA